MQEKGTQSVFKLLRSVQNHVMNHESWPIKLNTQLRKSSYKVSDHISDNIKVAIWLLSVLF